MQAGCCALHCCQLTVLDAVAVSITYSLCTLSTARCVHVGSSEVGYIMDSLAVCFLFDSCMFGNYAWVGHMFL